MRRIHCRITIEAIQRRSAMCRVSPWTLPYQKFLLCVYSQGQDLYSHQKLNMHVHLLVLIWERLQTPTTTMTTTPTTPDATVQPLGRHIANNVDAILWRGLLTGTLKQLLDSVETVLQRGGARLLVRWNSWRTPAKTPTTSISTTTWTTSTRTSTVPYTSSILPALSTFYVHARWNSSAAFASWLPDFGKNTVSAWSQYTRLPCCRPWACHSGAKHGQHIRKINKFHLRCLGKLVWITWKRNDSSARIQQRSPWQPFYLQFVQPWHTSDSSHMREHIDEICRIDDSLLHFLHARWNS